MAVASLVVVVPEVDFTFVEHAPVLFEDLPFPLAFILAPPCFAFFLGWSSAPGRGVVVVVADAGKGSMDQGVCGGIGLKT